MTWRQQPPIRSPIPTRAIVDGIGAAIGFGVGASETVAGILCTRYGAVDALLTDSGTSALILALRTILPRGGTVAYPSYSCIDLTAAAVGAEAHVRLYEIDPITLSPDLESVRSAIGRGVDAIVVAHLYGYPADVIGVRNLAAEHGIPVIEDAAQGAGGSLCGARLGSFGDVTILSFARGKGTTGGSGGAILAKTPALAEWLRVARADLKPGLHGGLDVLNLAAQRLFSHPSLYRFPASVPGLKLGEMVYRAPRPPRAMSAASAAVLRSTLELEEREISNRRQRARYLLSRLRAGPRVASVRAIMGGEPGFLRLPLLDTYGRLRPRPDLGVLHGYPMTLEEHQPLRPLLLGGERAGTGARQLRDNLFTAPTHSGVDWSDLDQVSRWLNGYQAGTGAVGMS